MPKPLFVGSFEDAVLAVILHTNLESVAIPRRAAGHDAEGDMRAAFYMACDYDGCEHVLDVKAIHGDDANPGLKLISPSVVGEKSKKGEAVATGVGTSRRQRSHATAQETRQTEKSHD